MVVLAERALAALGILPMAVLAEQALAALGISRMVVQDVPMVLPMDQLAQVVALAMVVVVAAVAVAVIRLLHSAVPIQSKMTQSKRKRPLNWKVRFLPCLLGLCSV
jgi:hypothetical protein